MKRIAFYLRVSKRDRQDVERQHRDLVKLLEWEPDSELIFVYKDTMSGGEANRPDFRRMLKEAKNHSFGELWFWALDRFSREGILSTLRYLKHLDACGVTVRSYSEPYINTVDPLTRDIVISIFSAIAKNERMVISERTKSGLARARANGKTLGRKPGSRDKKPRRKSGYLLRWQKDK